MNNISINKVSNSQPYYLIFFILLILLDCTASLFAQNKLVVSGAGTAAVNGTYTEAGTANSRPYYTLGNYRIEYRDGGFGLEWEIWDTVEPNSNNEVKYYNTSSGNTPVVNGWQIDVASPTAPSVTNLIYVTDGSSFTAPAPTLGTNNNPIGRFQLDPGADGSTLTAITIVLNGSVTGINSVKLWSSSDGTFNAGSDIMLNSQSYGATVNFSAFSSPITITGLYYFVTLDLSAGATGNISAQIPSQASLTVTSGSIENTFTNSNLSNSDAPLPVELQKFTAVFQNAKVKLEWTTATEVNNYGFEIERASLGTMPGKDYLKWEKIGFVPGAGNSNSPKIYSFTDNSIPANVKYLYRLKQIDFNGTYNYSDEKEVLINSASESFSVEQNVPNPCNPSTNIKFNLPKEGKVVVKIYNILGKEISTLLDETRTAGSHTVTWNGIDAFGREVSSGIYLYNISFDGQSITKKMLLVR